MSIELDIIEEQISSAQNAIIELYKDPDTSHNGINVVLAAEKYIEMLKIFKERVDK